MLYNLKLCHEGECFEVTVDEDTYLELINDEEKLSQYTLQMRQLFYRDSRSSAGPSSCPETMSEAENTPLGETSTNANKTSEETFRWTPNLILLLIEKRLEKEHEFIRPVCKKKKLWTLIANEMNKVQDYHFRGDMCDIKYRNLLATYKVNKKKSQQSGEAAVSWEYFEKFDSVLGTKASSFPSRAVVGSVETVQETSSTEETEKENNKLEPPKEGKKKRLTKKKCFGIEQYLLEKEKARVEKEKKDEERWKEKKELREREISAIEKLAEAIASQYKQTKETP